MINLILDSRFRFDTEPKVENRNLVNIEKDMQ